MIEYLCRQKVISNIHFKLNIPLIYFKVKIKVSKKIQPDIFSPESKPKPQGEVPLLCLQVGY